MANLELILLWFLRFVFYDRDFSGKRFSFVTTFERYLEDLKTKIFFRG